MFTFSNQLSSAQSRAMFSKLKWGLPFLASLLPIVLLSIFSFRIASQSVEDLVEAGNQSATSNLSQLITQDVTQTIGLAHAVASVPGTVDAVRRHDDIAMSTRLKGIVLAYPQIDRAFVTDRTGRLWSDYPAVDELYGKDLSDHDWFTGVSKDWTPYVSGVYLREPDKAYPVVAMSVPIFDEDKQFVLGTLVFEYRIKNILKWLQNVRLSQTGHLYVVDQTGTVVAHPRLEATDLSSLYASVAPIQNALQGTVLTERYNDPLSNQEMMATFLPISVADNTWAIVAQQPVVEAYAMLDRVKWQISLAGSLLTLVTLAMVIALARTSAKNIRLNRELEVKNTQLKDITSIISHQLRAPVTSISFALETILDGDYGPVPSELQEPLKMLRDVNVGNKKLIEDILNASRIDRGVIGVETAPTSLKEICERSMRDYVHPAEEQHLYLKLEGDDIQVMADLEKTAEAVSNAISNAIKYTKQGGITLKMSRDGNFGRIDVADTGEGMPEEVRQNLFSRTGTKKTNTDSSKSTGLGLYIAKNFMQLQKGDVEVASEIGKGTTFIYRLPLA